MHGFGHAILLAHQILNVKLTLTASTVASPSYLCLKKIPLKTLSPEITYRLYQRSK